MTNVKHINLPFRIETRTDAYAVISNGYQFTAYVAAYGEVDAEYDSQYDVWRVPELAESIAAFSEAKQRDCEMWGCE